MEDKATKKRSPTYYLGMLFLVAIPVALVVLDQQSRDVWEHLVKMFQSSISFVFGLIILAINKYWQPKQAHGEWIKFVVIIATMAVIYGGLIIRNSLNNAGCMEMGEGRGTVCY